MITSSYFVRAALRAVSVALLAVAVGWPTEPRAQGQPERLGARWVATWGAAPAEALPAPDLLTLDNQTLRLIVHTSIGGSHVRVRVSNEFGRTPLRIGAAHVALRDKGAAIVPGTDRVLTFSGRASITIPPGAPALSDPVALAVPALSDLAVSLYFPWPAPATTVHALAVQTNYISGPGDFTGAASVPTIATTTTWPFLTEVDVITPSLGATVVALGDSLTDGLATTNDANQRWPDFLARRLQANRETFAPAGGDLPNPLRQLAMGRKFGIVNRGLNGNRLLRDFDGTAVSLAGLVRFDRDVLASAGAEYVIVLLGINDIGVAGLVPGEVPVTADELVAGYRQLIARAHTRGLIIFGGTLTPFEGSSPGYYTPEKEQVRQAVNQWLRTSNEFDAVIDFDRAIRDPDQPSRMLPAFDSGDHLHPSDLGMQALANAVPLEFFHGAGSADLKKKLRK